MMKTRQTVEHESAEESRKRAEQDSQLEHDREESRNREKAYGFPVNDQRIEKRRWDKLQTDSSGKSGETAAKDNVTEIRLAQAHRLVHPMNRKGRMNIPETISFVADLLSGMVKLRRRCEFCDRRKWLWFSSGCGHACASPSSSVVVSGCGVSGTWCGSASGKTDLTSEMATIGRKRIKSRKRVTKIPMVPTNVQISTQ